MYALYNRLIALLISWGFLIRIKAKKPKAKARKSNKPRLTLKQLDERVKKLERGRRKKT